MSHLIEFVAGKHSARQVLDDLQTALDSIQAALAAHAQRLVTSRSPLAWKHLAVRLPSQHAARTIRVAKPSESLGEIVNQLATAARLADALEFVLAHDDDALVTACNPTTSSVGHDLEATVADQHWAFEVSDVVSGNGNAKMQKDLATASLALSSGKAAFLAVSPASARWLTGRTSVPERLGLSIQLDQHASCTHGTVFARITPRTS